MLVMWEGDEIDTKEKAVPYLLHELELCVHHVDFVGRSIRIVVVLVW
jgi:hypothetical protein